MRLAIFSSILLAAPCFGSAVFQISIDASSLPPATSGFIDFTLNGGFPATATISNFSDPGGSLAPEASFCKTLPARFPAR